MEERSAAKPSVLIILFLLFAPAVLSAPQQDNTRPQEAETPPVTDPTIEHPDYQWLDGFNNSIVNLLDESALWLDSQFIDEQLAKSQQQGLDKATVAEQEKEKKKKKEQPRAKAKIVFGWEPKDGDLSRVPLKFKIKIKLPSLKNKVDLIFSDNELQDFNQLPLESSRPEDTRTEPEDFSAAIRILHQKRENGYLSSRIGIGRSQPYARSRYRWRKTLSPKWLLNVEPAVEYYANDGAGFRFLTELSFFSVKQQEFRLSYSIWNREDLEEPQWKAGFYNIYSLDDDTSMVNGLLVRGETSPSYRDNKITISSRWRIRALRKWLFFELEPFVDFEREDDYDPEFGVAMRVGGYFGY